MQVAKKIFVCVLIGATVLYASVIFHMGKYSKAIFKISNILHLNNVPNCQPPIIQSLESRTKQTSKKLQVKGSSEPLAINKSIPIVPCDLSNKSSHCITLVTGYFAFGKSKHSLDQYKDWLKNFLGQVETPIVIFTQPSLQPLMAKLREVKPTHFILYEEVWDIPWLNEPRFLYQDYHKMHGIDPEKKLHSPEVYAVWNSKPWMLSRATGLNPFNSTYFYWMDMGCVRDSKVVLKNYPSLERVMSVFGLDEKSVEFHKLNVFTIRAFQNYKRPPGSNTFYEMSRMDFVVGGFFGGTAAIVDWFQRCFYHLHDQKLAEGVFMGKEQTLFNWIVTQNPEKVLVVSSAYQSPWECGNRWLYFQKWYATNNVSLKCANTPAKNMTDFLIEFKK